MHHHLRILCTLGALLWFSDAYAGTVSLMTSDGVALQGTQFGSGKHGVVLVHDKGRSQEDWTFFAEKLAQAPLNVVAINLRGHGAAASAPAAEDYPKMVADVAAAVAWLRSKGATRVDVVGAGFGANLALQAAAADPGIATAVLLSPGLNLQGVTLSSAVAGYGARPLLVVASQEDTYALRSGTYLEEKILGEKKFELLEDAGSGVKMLNRAPALEGLLLSWLNGSYELTAGIGKPDKLNTGDSTSIETKGKKFGEH